MTDNESRLNLVEDMIDLLITQLPPEVESAPRAKIVLQAYREHRELMLGGSAAPAPRGAWLR